MFQTAGKGKPISISEESMAKANKLFSSSDGNASYCQKPAQRSDTSMLRVARMRNSNALTPGNKSTNGGLGKAKAM
eukprot:9678694-Ditylum_brightwellii.AAC.1